jgi:hypothetical protein
MAAIWGNYFIAEAESIAKAESMNDDVRPSTWPATPMLC